MTGHRCHKMYLILHCCSALSLSHTIESEIAILFPERAPLRNEVMKLAYPRSKPIFLSNEMSEGYLPGAWLAHNNDPLPPFLFFFLELVRFVRGKNRVRFSFFFFPLYVFFGFFFLSSEIYFLHLIRWEDTRVLGGTRVDKGVLFSGVHS